MSGNALRRLNRVALVEEVGEVARELCERAMAGGHMSPALLDETTRLALRAELVQTAAMVTAWVAACDETAGVTRHDRPSGVEMITAERQRQIDTEGWTPEHDAAHWDDDLAMAAVCYATPPSRRPVSVQQETMRPEGWPWDLRRWKPSPDRVRELVKAGALIAAEIDRLAADGEAQA